MRSGAPVRVAALLAGLAVAGCGQDVDPGQARAACAADQRVHDTLAQDAALRAAVGGVTPARAGEAPEYDSFTRQCATNFLTVTWTRVALPPAEAMAVLTQRLRAEGWVDTTAPAVARSNALLRGFRRHVGSDMVKLRVELDPATRTLAARGERAIST